MHEDQEVKLEPRNWWADGIAMLVWALCCIPIASLFTYLMNQHLLWAALLLMCVATPLFAIFVVNGFRRILRHRS